MGAAATQFNEGPALKRPPRQLADQWRRKLADAGFRDVETANPDAPLKTDIRTDGRSVMAREGEERAQYYRLALAFLHGHDFADNEERRIWQRHAEGMSYVDIAASIECTQWRVQTTVERLGALMRLPRPKVGRPPAGPTGHGDQQYRRRVRFSDVETEALHFIATHSNLTPIDAIRMAVLMYARAIRISGAGNSHAPVHKKGDDDNG